MELFTSKYINLKNNERVYIIYLPHLLLIDVSSVLFRKKKIDLLFLMSTGIDKNTSLEEQACA